MNPFFTVSRTSFHHMCKAGVIIRNFVCVYIIAIVLFLILLAELFKAIIIPITINMPSKKKEQNMKLAKAKKSPYTMPLLLPRDTSPKRRELKRCETTTSSAKYSSSITKEGDSLTGVRVTYKVSPNTIRAKSSLVIRKQDTSPEKAKTSVTGTARVPLEPRLYASCRKFTGNGDREYKSTAKESEHQGKVRQRMKNISVRDLPQAPVHIKRPKVSCKKLSPAEIKRQQEEHKLRAQQQEEERRIRALEREKQKRHSEMVAFVEKHCKLRIENGVRVHLADADVCYEDRGARIRAVEVGTSDMNADDKVLLVVGGTGSGKSTMINALFNYIVGVDWKDNFRLKLVEDAGMRRRGGVNQALSQTNWITAYTIHVQSFFRINFTLTIVDTPGFCDTSGIKRDREITEQMKEFFTTSPDMGIHALDAVGFVVQSSLPRLTVHQIHSYESVLSLFGHNLTENIFMLLTFADGQKPQVLSGIHEARLPYRHCFKFNNSALYARKGTSSGSDIDDDDDDDFDEMFWRMTCSSLKAFTEELCNVEKASLIPTRDVLNERSELENTVHKLQRKFTKGLNILEQIESKEKRLQMIKSDVRKNKNYTYRVKEETTETEPAQPGQYTSNCTRCNTTCCDDCPFNDDDDKRRCCVMRNGRCTVCPQRCAWWRHKNQPYVYVVCTEYVWKTSYNMKRKFKEAERKRLMAQQEIDGHQNEFRKVKRATERLTHDARESFYNLEKNALWPKLTNEAAYIDVLIRNEQSSCDAGRQRRITELTELRKRVQLLDELSEDYFDPFENYF